MCSGRSPKRRLPSTGGRSASQAWAAAYLLFLLLPPVILVNDSGLSLERLRDHTAGAHKAEIRSARSRKKDPSSSRGCWTGYRRNSFWIPPRGVVAACFRRGRVYRGAVDMRPGP